MFGVETFKTALLAGLITIAALAACDGSKTVEARPLPMHVPINMSDSLAG